MNKLRSIMKELKYYLFPFIILFVFQSCSGSKNSQKINHQLKYSIVYGSGGGFTGFRSGKYIDSLGVIYKWEGITFSKAQKVKIDSLSKSQIKKINDFLIKNPLENYSSNESGNSTIFLTLKASGKEIKFSWNENASSSKVPAKVKEFYQLLLDISKNK